MTVVDVQRLPPAVPVRFPWGTGWEEELARANHQCGGRSRRFLDGWISGLPEVLTGDIATTRVVGTDGRDLYGRAELAEDLARIDALDSFRIYHNGELIDIDPFLQRHHILHRPGVVNASRLLNYTHDGYTFNIGTVDRWHPRLNELMTHLERLIGGPAEVYVFVSGGNTPASPLHFDQPELIVLPVEGPKFWDVRQSSFEFAMGPDFVDHGEPPVAFGRALSVGEALVVPRGWLHKAAPVGQFSVCLTVGLFRHFVARPLIDAIERSTEITELRRPRSSGHRVPHGVRALAGTISELAHGAVSEAGFTGWWASELARMPVRNDGPVVWDLADHQELPLTTRVRNRLPGGFMAIGDVRGAPTFGGGGFLVTTTDDATCVLAEVLSADGESLEELADRSVDPDAALMVGARLAAEGVLDIAPESP